ncbi:hypothetical protein O1L60_32690 [Streptomyces diastatochromogenes]|nr:hypothetical protein [Streptomyces diastatochromogenes]
MATARSSSSVIGWRRRRAAFGSAWTSSTISVASPSWSSPRSTAEARISVGRTSGPPRAARTPPRLPGVGVPLAEGAVQLLLEARQETGVARGRDLVGEVDRLVHVGVQIVQHLGQPGQ